MGLGNINGWSFDDDTDKELVKIMDKFLPSKWRKNAIQRRQIYRVVEHFLKTPRQMEIKEREKRAREMTLEKEENVDTDRTIADATARRLYSQPPYQEKFRRALERIEQNYKR